MKISIKIDWSNKFTLTLLITPLNYVHFINLSNILTYLTTFQYFMNLYGDEWWVYMKNIIGVLKNPRK